MKNTVYTCTVFKAIKIVPMCQNRYALPTFLTTLVIPTHGLQSIFCPSFTSYSTKTKQTVAPSFPLNCWKGGGGNIPSVPSKCIETKQSSVVRIKLTTFAASGLKCSISLLTTVHEHSRATELSVWSLAAYLRRNIFGWLSFLGGSNRFKTSSCPL